MKPRRPTTIAPGGGSNDDEPGYFYGDGTAEPVELGIPKEAGAQSCPASGPTMLAWSPGLARCRD